MNRASFAEERRTGNTLFGSTEGYVSKWEVNERLRVLKQNGVIGADVPVEVVE